MENLERTYKNPFSDYNANVMDTKKILDYWCSPFDFIHSSGVSEKDIYRHGNPIVFMGGRGTGKTMFLKYWSYQVQRDKAINMAKSIANPIIRHINDVGGIGFYVRIDGPVLRSFAHKGVSPEQWETIFSHYFELVICRSYVDVLSDLVKRGDLSLKDIDDKLVPELCRLLGCEGKNTIDDILVEVEKRIREVANYRSAISFSNVRFRPSKGFGSQDLSFTIPSLCRECIRELKNINFIVLIDEYENFLDNQQRIVNTLMKFVKEGISFRIGMRLEGFHTYDTISENEFIKVGRDYQEFVFENVLLRDSDYGKFLFEVAKKRLSSVPYFADRELTNIKKFLGEKENLEEEANELISKRRDKKAHFKIINNVKHKYPNKYVLKCLSAENNPLMEMLNILVFLRRGDPKRINSMMTDYINKKHTSDATKYKHDYIDKYKLTLMFLLASIYRGNKKYYSFNTFMYLSSGIVGHFIELCRITFQNAYFEYKESLLKGNVIDKKIQDKAARETAGSEFRMITRIPKYGDSLYILAKNLGNTFRAYHSDLHARYPETNQFAVDIAAIEDEDVRKAFRAALEWSIIQQKPGLQRTTPGSPRGDIYTLNRILSPLFEITYRTRGGYSIPFRKDEFGLMLQEENVRIKRPKNVSLIPERGERSELREIIDAQQKFKF